MLGHSSSNVPVDISGVTDAAQITVGQQHACMIRRTTSTAACWGRNEFGQLGNGTMTNSLTPVDVLDILSVSSISAGSGHLCARHSDRVSCWGANDVNQLGDGTLTNRSRPISVYGFQ